MHRLGQLHSIARQITESNWHAENRQHTQDVTKIVHTHQPAQGVTCHTCGKRGHFSKVCQLAKAVHAVTKDSSLFQGIVAGKDQCLVEIQTNKKIENPSYWQSQTSGSHGLGRPITAMPQMWGEWGGGENNLKSPPIDRVRRQGNKKC